MMNRYEKAVKSAHDNMLGLMNQQRDTVLWESKYRKAQKRLATAKANLDDHISKEAYKADVIHMWNHGCK